MKGNFILVVCLLLFSSIHALASDGDNRPEGAVVNIGSQEELMKLLESINSTQNETKFLLVPVPTGFSINNADSVLSNASLLSNAQLLSLNCGVSSSRRVCTQTNGPCPTSGCPSCASNGTHVACCVEAKSDNSGVHC